MNEKEPFKALRDIEIDRVKRAQDFDRIEQRVNQKVFHWQIPAVAFGIACIIFFLLVSMPVQDKQLVQSKDERQMVKTLSFAGDGEPNSRWQLGVNVKTDSESIEKMERLIDYLVPIEQPQGTREVVKSLKILYSDGSIERWQEIQFSGKWTFYDVNQQQYFELPKDYYFYANFLMMYNWNDNSSSLFAILAFCIVIGLLQTFIQKKIKQTTLEYGKDGAHSTYWQTVSVILVIILVGALFFSVELLHFLVVVLLLFVSFLINVWLENKNGNNNWRKLSLLCNMAFQTGVMYVTFISWL